MIYVVWRGGSDCPLPRNTWLRKLEDDGAGGIGVYLQKCNKTGGIISDFMYPFAMLEPFIIRIQKGGIDERALINRQKQADGTDASFHQHSKW